MLITMEFSRRPFRFLIIFLILSVVVLVGLNMGLFVVDQTKEPAPAVGVERFIQATPPEARRCGMDTCFSYSKCSLFSAFPVFFYTDKDHSSSSSVSRGVSDSLLSAVSENVLRTLHAERACVHVLIFDSRGSRSHSSSDLQTFLRSLPSWNGEGGGGGGGGGKGGGSNHVLVNLVTSSDNNNNNNNNLFDGVDVGHAIVAQSSFTASADTIATTTNTTTTTSFRPDYDIVIPPYSVDDAETAVAGSSPELPPLSPARRKYLFSFVGENTASGPSEAAVSRGKVLSALLKDLQGKSPSELKIDLSCGNLQEGGRGGGKANDEWRLCGDAQQRAGVLARSTFALLVAPSEDTHASTLSFQTRLYEALKNGAVPVILGGGRVRGQEVMPYRELLRWEESTLTLSMGQASELLPFLVAFGDGDIAQLRFKGRVLWENYFSSPRRIVDMTLATVRSRLQIPALPARREPAVTFFNATFVNKTVAGGPLGPLGPLFASDEFQRNFSRTAMLDSFNRPGGDPFSLFPHTPFQPVLPTAAYLWGDRYGLHPVGQREPGPNKQFSPVLGGNWPQEQFTVVMLTYKRTESLMAALRRLMDQPFLNKIIVVWNDPEPPNSTLEWPQLHVPVEVLKQRTNSLNNRFLPFDNIQTECILSLDDDVVISKENIMAGFRVWREERDRLVGYLPRRHNWDAHNSRWLYGAKQTPGNSMVLTSATFFHAYYLYLYSYVMPRAVYDHVKNNMNCEDIAMNFLVSHVTRKPILLVDVKWTLHCPGCKGGLSTRSDHYRERRECMNVLTRAWGYMPLLYSQHRVVKA